MEQIQDGIYAVEETMPCNPKDIRVGKYTLLSTLQRAEREEAAARILTFSQQLDCWVGVSWRRLGKMMQEEYEQFKQVNDAKEHNFEEEWRFPGVIRKYYILSVLTLGIYALFVAKPRKQLQEVPKYNMPFSGLFIAGPNHVTSGIHELVDMGMLTHIQEGEGENVIDIFYPTPSLISTIMKKQGLATT